MPAKTVIFSNGGEVDGKQDTLLAGSVGYTIDILNYVTRRVN